MENSIRLNDYNYILKKFLEVKMNMGKTKSKIEFTGEELEFIEEQSKYEKYIDKLISKIRIERNIDSDELAELECSSKVEYTEFIDEDDLSNDNKMKLVLITGEELEFELV